jgi:transposase-like protein
MDNIKCPECKSTKVWRKGHVPNRKGPKARYVCYTCGRSFYKPKETPAKAPPKKKSKG